MQKVKPRWTLEHPIKPDQGRSNCNSTDASEQEKPSEMYSEVITGSENTNLTIHIGD